MTRAHRVVATTLALGLLGTAAARAAGPTATRIAASDAAVADGVRGSARAACTVGNDGPASVGASGFVPLPLEEFRLVFDPSATCATCPDGFRVSTIHIVLQVAEACTLTISPNLGTVAYPGAPDCAQPDRVGCQGDPRVVVLGGAGVWDVALPADCRCERADVLHTVGVTLHSMSCWPVLMTDGSPRPCTNWDNIGWGWVDLPESDSTWPGDLVLYADATCCVATDAPASADAPGATFRVFPNPAPRGATLAFALPEAAPVELTVHDVRGRLVATLEHGVLGRGTYRVAWSARDDRGRELPAGIYFARLVAGGRSWTRRIVVVR